jgi:hypothetical protein
VQCLCRAAWPGKQWEMSLFLKDTSQQAPNYTEFDERTSWFYQAVGVSVGMMGRTVGAGQIYLEAAKDRAGRWLDGGKTYQLHVPPNAPVALFWSFTVYDNETRCFVDTGVQPDRSSRDNIEKNSDARWISTSARTPLPRNRKRTGSRPSPAKAGSLTSVSTARPSLISTVAGCCRISKK